MLILPIKKKWFDMILSGEKLVEYRDMTPYYDSRLERYIGQHIQVLFRNGYSEKSSSMICTVSVGTGTGKREWGAEQGREYYKLHILKLEYQK